MSQDGALGSAGCPAGKHDKGLVLFQQGSRRFLFAALLEQGLITLGKFGNIGSQADEAANPGQPGPDFLGLTGKVLVEI